MSKRSFSQVASKTSVSKFMADANSKTEDAELGLYLIRIVEQFRSIEKKIFKKYRNEELTKKKLENSKRRRLNKFY